MVLLCQYEHTFFFPRPRHNVSNAGKTFMFPEKMIDLHLYACTPPALPPFSKTSRKKERFLFLWNHPSLRLLLFLPIVIPSPIHISLTIPLFPPENPISKSPPPHSHNGAKTRAEMNVKFVLGYHCILILTS